MPGYPDWSKLLVQLFLSPPPGSCLPFAALIGHLLHRHLLFLSNVSCTKTIYIQLCSGQTPVHIHSHGAFYICWMFMFRVWFKGYLPFLHSLSSAYNLDFSLLFQLHSSRTKGIICHFNKIMYSICKSFNFFSYKK